MATSCLGPLQPPVHGRDVDAAGLWSRFLGGCCYFTDSSVYAYGTWTLWARLRVSDRKQCIQFIVIYMTFCNRENNFNCLKRDCISQVTYHLSNAVLSLTSFRLTLLLRRSVSQESSLQYAMTFKGKHTLQLGSMNINASPHP